MSQTTYHDVLDEELQGIAFLASNSVIYSSWFWLWHTFNVVPEVIYWWKEFDGCSLDLYMLFEDPKDCARFHNDCVTFGIHPDNCIVVPSSLHSRFITDNRVKIIYDVRESEEQLSLIAAHYSRRDST